MFQAASKRHARYIRSGLVGLSIGDSISLPYKDDDFDTVEVFSEFLSLQNIDVLGKAYNGLDGIKLFEEKQPDIIFSDLWMPEYDGFYLITKLREKFKDAKIIMVTADLTQETEIRIETNQEGTNHLINGRIPTSSILSIDEGLPLSLRVICSSIGGEEVLFGLDYLRLSRR